MPKTKKVKSDKNRSWSQGFSCCCCFYSNAPAINHHTTLYFWALTFQHARFGVWVWRTLWGAQVKKEKKNFAPEELSTKPDTGLRERPSVPRVGWTEPQECGVSVCLSVTYWPNWLLLHPGFQPLEGPVSPTLTWVRSVAWAAVRPPPTSSPEDCERNFLQPVGPSCLNLCLPFILLFLNLFPELFLILFSPPYYIGISMFYSYCFWKYP